MGQQPTGFLSGASTISSASEMRQFWPDAEVRGRGDWPFSATVTRRDLPQSRVEGIVATPHTSASPSGLIIERLGEVVILEAVVGGIAVIGHGDTSVVLKTGDLLLRRAGADRYDFPESVHLVRIAIASGAVFSINDVGADLFDVVQRSAMTDVLVHLLQSVLADAESGTDSSPRINHLLEQALMALAQPLVLDVAQRRDPQGLGERAVKAQAETFILKNYRLASLTPEDIAESLGISRRWLFRAFEGQPYSLAQTIKRIRVTSATRELMTNPYLTNGDLAQISGFSTNDQFRRAFRAHHGMTVGTYRTKFSAGA